MKVVKGKLKFSLGLTDTFHHAQAKLCHSVATGQLEKAVAEGLRLPSSLVLPSEA
jgi:hypothetical protein